MSVLARVLRRRSVDPWPALTLNDYISMLNYGGMAYAPSPQFTLGQKTEEIVPNFTGFVQGALKTNGVIFACMVARAQLFSEAVFKFQRFQAGRPGDLFGTPALLPLENPWPKATTGDLLARISMDADLTGNAYIALGDPSPMNPRGPKQLRRLRPDWVTIIAGSRKGIKEDSPLWQWDAEPIGYLYHPGGIGRSRPQPLLAEQVAHFTPWGLDPEAAFVGISPLQPIVEEIMADKGMTVHKRMFLENGATPNMVVSLPPEVTPDKFNEWVEVFEEEHEGVMNAYRTIYLGGGSDVTVVGTDLQKLSFAEVQSHGETRIAAALRVEPIIAGITAGLDASTYSNYAQALRAFADLTVRPWWRNVAGTLEDLIVTPSGTRLWYDDRDIAYLRQDAKHIAEIQVAQATSAELLVRAGYDPESVTAYLAANDINLLTHSGLASVQLQPIGSLKNPAEGSTLPSKPAAKKPAPKPAAPSPTGANAERDEIPELMPLRHEEWDRRDDRTKMWTALRVQPRTSIQCPYCYRHATMVQRDTAWCECGTYWRAHEHDYERGSVLVEHYVPVGQEYQYRNVDDLIATPDVMPRTNGRAKPEQRDVFLLPPASE